MFINRTTTGKLSTHKVLLLDMSSKDKRKTFKLIGTYQLVRIIFLLRIRVPNHELLVLILPVHVIDWLVHVVLILHLFKIAAVIRRHA